MRKVIVSTIAVSTLFFSGCASAPKFTFEDARDNCMRSGFKPGTDLFLQCVNHQFAQANKPSFLQEYMMQRATAAASDSRRSTEVVCKPWLNGIRCEEW